MHIFQGSDVVSKNKPRGLEPLVKMRILDLYFGGKSTKDISNYLDIPAMAINRFIKHFNEYNDTFTVPLTVSRARLIHRSLRYYMRHELAEFGNFDSYTDYIPAIWQHIRDISTEHDAKSEEIRQSYFEKMKLCEQWKALDFQMMQAIYKK